DRTGNRARIDVRAEKLVVETERPSEQYERIADRDTAIAVEISAIRSPSHAGARRHGETDEQKESRDPEHAHGGVLTRGPPSRNVGHTEGHRAGGSASEPDRDEKQHGLAHLRHDRIDRRRLRAKYGSASGTRSRTQPATEVSHVQVRELRKRL